jgi:REP element-mobilizing transposase RayT
VHVTLRVVRGVPSLRSQVCFRAVKRAFAAGKARLGFRLVHFSVQGDHMHLIAEADDTRALSRGMQGLGVRVARGLNGAVKRKGRVFAERFHAKPLGSPTQVRNALIYVLRNSDKHDLQAGGRITSELDPRSSAATFDGWRTRAPCWRIDDDDGDDDADGDGETAVAPPRTWLLSVGWQKVGGLLHSSEIPKV